MVKQREVLSTDKVKKIIDMAPTFEEQLMIMVMIQTGIRVSELINFKRDWINFEENYIRVQNNKKPIEWTPKRESERMIPISEELVRDLKRHIGNRKKGYIFQSQKSRTTVNIKGKTVKIKKNYRYEYRSIIRKINKISKKMMGKNIATHIFRATYATYLLSENVDIESIRKLLGHADIKTTWLYIRRLPDFSSWDKVRNIKLMKLDVKLKDPSKKRRII